MTGKFYLSLRSRLLTRVEKIRLTICGLAVLFFGDDRHGRHINDTRKDSDR